MSSCRLRAMTIASSLMGGCGLSHKRAEDGCKDTYVKFGGWKPDRTWVHRLKVTSTENNPSGNGLNSRLFPLESTWQFSTQTAHLDLYTCAWIMKWFLRMDKFWPARLVWGVNCVRFNVHNFSTMSIASNMPPCIHNMPPCMHSLPSCMHNLSYTSMQFIVHAQHAIFHSQHVKQQHVYNMVVPARLCPHVLHC